MKDFFDAVKDSLFGGKLSQSQVDGIVAINEAFVRAKGTDKRKLAYMLATAYHETGKRMEPVREGFSSSDEQAIARVTSYVNKINQTRPAGKKKVNYALRDINTHQSYFGRGYVQLTHKSNYQKAGDYLNLPLVIRPDLALQKNVAADIMVKGMLLGWFGDNLAGYFNDTTEKPEEARHTVNGTDKAELIAGYYWKFKEALL